MVVDEADWGMAVDSKINQFLVSLANHLEANPTTKLLLLIVSATMEVLTRILHNPRKYDEERIDWKLARLNHAELFIVPV